MKYDHAFSIDADIGHLSPGITIMAESRCKGDLSIHVEGGGLPSYSLADAELIATTILRTIAKAKRAYRKLHGVAP